MQAADPITDTVLLTELEAAINHWRALEPSSSDAMVLSKKVNALATPYATMIVQHLKEIPFRDLSSKAQEVLTAYRDSKRNFAS